MLTKDTFWVAGCTYYIKQKTKKTFLGAVKDANTHYNIPR
jgi:hypothetical protein